MIQNISNRGSAIIFALPRFCYIIGENRLSDIDFEAYLYESLATESNFAKQAEVAVEVHSRSDG